ncbi:uncharacterized protein [Ptychodera flava]|uniref:uncharacterized protein n=1 Tax=Ptychodera flava TaxID=63121 RepID=UPI00396A64C6
MVTMTAIHGEDSDDVSSVFIDAYDVQRIRYIGPSNYGELFQGKHRDFGLVMVRTVPTDEKESLKVEREVTSLIAMATTNHLLKMHGIIKEPGNRSIVTEFVTHGSLRQFQSKCNHVTPWPLQYRLIAEVVNAMAFLHRHQVIHGSLKSDNILIDDEFHAKVSDYGMTSLKSQITRQDSPVNNNRRSLPSRNMSIVPPEYIMDPNKQMNKSYDIYSFGIALWELVTGKECYPSAQTVEHMMFAVCQGCRPDISLLPEDCPTFLTSIMQECWHEIPEKRPSFQDLQKRIDAEYRANYEHLIEEAVLQVREILDRPSPRAGIDDVIVEDLDARCDDGIVEGVTLSGADDRTGSVDSRALVGEVRNEKPASSDDNATVNDTIQNHENHSSDKSSQLVEMEGQSNATGASVGKPTTADLYKVLEGLLALDDSVQVEQKLTRKRTASAGELLDVADTENINLVEVDHTVDRASSRDTQTVRFESKKKPSKEKPVFRRFVPNDESKKTKKFQKRTSWFGNSRSLSRTQSAYTFEEGGRKTRDSEELNQLSWSGESLSIARKRSNTSTSMPNLTSMKSNASAYEPELKCKVSNSASPKYDIRTPRGMAVSPDDVVFVCDPGNHRLQGFSLVKDFSWRFPRDNSDRRSTKKVYFDPRDVTISRDGCNIIVSDFASDSVFEISVSTVDTIGQYRSERLRGPWGIVQNDQSLVFVIGNKSHCIVVLREGNVERVIGKQGSAPGQFKSPSFIAIDRQGNLFVADCRNFRIQILNTEGAPLNCIQDKQKFPSITGIAIDNSNNLFVADDKLGYVWVYDVDGELKARIKRCHGDKKLSKPQGVAATGNGSIAVVDKMYVRVLNCWQLHPFKTD